MEHQEQHTPLEEEFFSQLGASLQKLEQRSNELEQRLACLNGLEGKLRALEVALSKPMPSKQEKTLIKIGFLCLPMASVLAWEEVVTESKECRVRMHTVVGAYWTAILKPDQYQQLVTSLREHFGTRTLKFEAGE